jgi:hypothetical protein
MHYGRISTWMEDHDYVAVNSEKTIFMKRVLEDWIMHGLFVDEMVHASTSDDLTTQRQFIEPDREIPRWFRDYL